MGSLLSRLDMLSCTDDGGSISELKGYIRNISHKLKKLSEVHDPPLTANYWMKHARELSYDIEAYLDDSDAKKDPDDSDAKKEDNPDDSDAKTEDSIDGSDDKTEDSVDDSDAKTEESVDDSDANMEDSIDHSDDETEETVDNADSSTLGSICISDYKISGFRTRAKGMIDRYESFSLDSVLSCPTAATTIVSPRLSRDVVPVGMLGNQITDLISLLQPKDENGNQLKIVSILGDEGIGKSTLVQEIWRESFKEKKIWPEPQSEVKVERAFVRMGKKPDVRMILRSILSQVSQQEPAKDSGVTNLIQDIRKLLEQKRYFIIVDDVRSLSVWDVVGRAFPHCSVGSRIITTTSDKEVAVACCSYVLQHIYNMKPLNVGDCKELFIRTLVGFGTVNLQLSNDVSDEIKRKCGGLPLAIMWTAILMASQPEIKEKLCQLETEQGLSKMEKEENLDSDVKKFLDKNLRTESTPVEILNQLLKLCYNSLPHYLKTCLLYLSVYPENYFFLKEDLVKLWIVEGFICSSEEDKIEVAGRYFDALVSLGLIQRMDINCNKQHRRLGEVHVVEDEGEDPLRLRVPYVVHPMVFDFITCRSIEDNFITIIDYSQSTVALKDKIHRLSLHFGSATYATTPAGLSQVRTLSFMGLLGCMPSLVEFKIVRVMILDLWADDEDIIFSLTEITELLLLKYLQVSCNVSVELPGKIGCLKHLQTLEINSRVTAVPSDILNISGLHHVRLEGKTYPTLGSVALVKAVGGEEYDRSAANFNVEIVPQVVEHSSSAMPRQIIGVDLGPTLIEPVNQKDKVTLISGTRGYFTTQQPINFDKMPVKDRNEHADWGMPQFSVETEENSPPEQKSGTGPQMSLSGKDMVVKLELLRSITNNFSEGQKVGTGGYGDVYRAIYEGKEIAVKKFHQHVGLDDEDFDNEVLSLREIQHQNIVRLLGYCYVAGYKYIEREGWPLIRAEHVDRVLCFEYMQGSLDKHISDEYCDLDWATSYKIIRGICEGLKHLHTARAKPILHMDLKPANILLDKNMTAKIGDLGLSKLVASTQAHTIEILKGTQGYMPPEYVNERKVSSKFDVFSLGVIIIKMLAGNKAYYSCREMPPEEFIKFVTEKWMQKLQGTCLSQETDILQVKTCVNIALRCVKDERKERPDIKSIVYELEKVEAQIKKMLLASDQSKNLIGLQRSSDSNAIAVDPALELRFLFEPRKDISCCLQLTNKTSDSIAFNIKTNQTKYYTEPSRGIMPPCSKCYVSVTLRAQEEAPPNMQCHDMLLVQSVNLSKELTTSSDEEITKDFFEKVMMEKVVDVVELPIVYVVRDLLRACPRVNR